MNARIARPLATVATAFALLLAGCNGEAASELALSREPTAPESAEEAAPASPTSPATPESAPTPGTPATPESAYPLGALVGEASDYSDEGNWYQIPETAHAVDTLFLYPTCHHDASAGAAEVCDIDDEGMRAAVPDAYQRFAKAFEASTNVYVPYYRQSNAASLVGVGASDLEAAQCQEQRTDVYAALDRYFERYNGGRPFVLAGHGQGSMMVRIALKDYFQAHPQLLKRMVAAYVVGFSFTQGDLDGHPNLKFAEGADDTGVVVSWNTEGPDNEGSAVVLPGAIAINPITWTRGTKRATAEENLGSRYADANGAYRLSSPGYADAKVDVDRGVVVTTQTRDPYLDQPRAGVDEPALGTKSLHGADYDLYFLNVQQNVADRCNAWLMRHGDDPEPLRNLGVRVVDLESRYYTQDFLNLAATRTEVPAYDPTSSQLEYAPDLWMDLRRSMPALLALDGTRVRAMDEAGVARAVLQGAPGVELVAGGEGVNLCRASNNQVAAATRAYPGRFVGSAVLPMTDVDAAMAELDRCAIELGFTSWTTQSNYGAAHLYDAEFLPLLKRAAELGVVVCLEPAAPADPSVAALGWSATPAGTGAAIDALETTMALVTTGTFDEVPRLKVVAAGCGATLPFLLGNMDARLAQGEVSPHANKHATSHYLQNNIWLTTSGITSEAALAFAKATMGADHLLVGTGFPYASAEDHLALLNGIDLTEAEREAIYHGNAEELLGI